MIKGSIPLPTTFLKELSDVINQKGTYSYDFLSKWNINKEKGLITDFEKKAFDYLYNKKGRFSHVFWCTKASTPFVTQLLISLLQKHA